MALPLSSASRLEWVKASSFYGGFGIYAEYPCRVNCPKFATVCEFGYRGVEVKTIPLY